jgi:hypothetical protein
VARSRSLSFWTLLLFSGRLLVMGVAPKSIVLLCSLASHISSSAAAG